MPNPLIVTGMHRSGTSLAASLIDKAGINLGNDFLPPDKANPRGFFEDSDFYAFHQKALTDRGYGILTTTEFNFVPTLNERRQAQTLILQRQGQLSWGWKDPRTSLFLNFWQELLPDATYLFLYRHPLDVLLSLIRRGEVHNVGLMEGLDAWFVYNTAIKSFYHKHADRCILCHTYGMVENINKFKNLMNQKLGFDLALNNNLLNSLYYPNELRRSVLDSDLMLLFKRLHPAAMDLYSELEATADVRAATGGEIPHPDLSSFRNFVWSLPEPIERPQARALLITLASLIDTDKLETLFQDYMAYDRKIEQDIIWLREQYLHWLTQAERWSAQVTEQQNWITQLEQGKAWLEEQRDNWYRISGEREQLIQEQQKWILELEKGKNWLEEQYQYWHKIAEERERIIQEQHKLSCSIEEEH